jgi:hypothetical protein
LLLLLPVLEFDELLEELLEDFRLERLLDEPLEFLSDPLPMRESLERLEFSAPVIALPAVL